ncbi:MAG: hypothetical protein QM619_08225 [Micropruina sp.]|uniref:hypothetical protein n=1 Tax=Micropruina sp. TaxID=2737536 RepID=UPI0039E6C69E
MASLAPATASRGNQPVLVGGDTSWAWSRVASFGQQIPDLGVDGARSPRAWAMAGWTAVIGRCLRRRWCFGSQRLGDGRLDAVVLAGAVLGAALTASAVAVRVEVTAVEAVLAAVPFMQAGMLVLGALPFTHEDAGSQILSTLAAVPHTGGVCCWRVRSPRR